MNNDQPNQSFNSVDSLKTSMSLVRAVVRKDPIAWEKLVRLYYPLVVRWAQKKGLGRDSEEIADEVLFKAVLGLKGFRKDEPNQLFRKWLRGIMNSVIADFFKNKPNAFGGSGTYMNNVPDQNFDDAEEVAQDRNTLLARAIHLLDQNSKNKKNSKVFMEVVVFGRKPKHVAEDFKIPVSRVYQIKSRYLKKLKSEFADLIPQYLDNSSP